MRLTFILFLLFQFFWANAQTPSLFLKQKIIFEQKQFQNLDELLGQIQKNSGTIFSYNPSILPEIRSISLDKKEVVLNELLQELLRPHEIEAIEVDGIIILRKRKNTDPIIINGIVKDNESKQPVPFAQIIVKNTTTGTTSDENGKFELPLTSPEGEIEISCQGYDTKTLVVLKEEKKQEYEFSLDATTITLNEIFVYERKPNDKIENLEMGTHEVKMEQVKNMPVMFGEADALKSIQLLPGVQSVNEGIPGVLVRGGSADQSLILLDDSPVYNPAHLMGLFSIFNPDALQEVGIIKGGIPAQYGGRLSCIVYNNSKTANVEKLTMTGGIGLMSSRLSIETPVIKEKASLMLSARRTYFDLLMYMAPSAFNDARLYFYDINGKFDYKIDQKNRFTFSAYSGKDRFILRDLGGINWGNAMASAQWHHMVNPKLMTTTSLNHSLYRYNFMVDFEEEASLTWKNKFEEFSTKSDWNYQATSNYSVKFGYQGFGRSFSPALLKIEESFLGNTKIETDKQYSYEHALYLNHDFNLHPKFAMQYGIRYSLFHDLGPGRVFTYADPENKNLNQITDTLYYRPGRIIKTYHGPEPRATLRYLINHTSSIKLSYNRMRQYIQLATNAAASLPFDRWVPASTYISPQIGDQITLGLFKNFKKNTIETSVELYYKHMQNQIDYKNSAFLMGNIGVPNSEIIFNNTLETMLLTGKGWSYGAEFFIKKNVGKTTGWISYTLSKTQRQINGINLGQPYSPRHDRPHDLAIVVFHQVSPRLSLNANWVYASGSAITLPEGKYTFDGKILPYFNPNTRNQSRMPDYHRLDLSITLLQKKKQNRRWQGSWNFSVYNAYFQRNPVFIYFKEVINGDPNLFPSPDLEIKSVELKAIKHYWGIIPAITYNFTW
jgi:hypothetical protein